MLLYSNPLCLSISLLFHSSVCLSAWPIIYTTNTYVYPSVRLFVLLCLSVCSSVFVCLFFCVCLFVLLSVCLFFCLSVHFNAPSIPSPLICLFINLCVCLRHPSMYLFSVCVCSSVYLCTHLLAIHVFNGQYVLACHLRTPSHQTIHL